jgi:hypothetical protein
MNGTCELEFSNTFKTEKSEITVANGERGERHRHKAKLRERGRRGHAHQYRRSVVAHPPWRAFGDPALHFQGRKMIER